jgi:hypothetical protein
MEGVPKKESYPSSAPSRMVVMLEREQMVRTSGVSIKRLLLIFGGVLLVALFVAAYLFLFYIPSYPRDEVLIRRFHENRQLFEELVTLFPDATSPEHVRLYTSDALRQYAEPVRRMGISGVYSDFYEDYTWQNGTHTRVATSHYRIYFELKRPSFPNSFLMPEKGYAYYTEPPNPQKLVPSLNSLERESEVYFLRYIEGSWYLYLHDWEE